MEPQIAVEGHPGYEISSSAPANGRGNYLVLQQCNYHKAKTISFFCIEDESPLHTEVALWKIHPTDLPLRDRMWARGFMEFSDGETGKTKFIATVTP